MCYIYTVMTFIVLHWTFGFSILCNCSVTFACCDIPHQCMYAHAEIFPLLNMLLPRKWCCSILDLKRRSIEFRGTLTWKRFLPCLPMCTQTWNNQSFTNHSAPSPFATQKTAASSTYVPCRKGYLWQFLMHRSNKICSNGGITQLAAICNIWVYSVSLQEEWNAIQLMAREKEAFLFTGSECCCMRRALVWQNVPRFPHPLQVIPSPVRHVNNWRT